MTEHRPSPARRSLRAAVCAAAGIAALCSCSPGRAPKGRDAAGSEPGPRIGFAIDSLTVERWQRDLDIFVAKAGELGAQVYSQDANNDAGEQRRQVEYLLDKGIDVLVIVPYDADLAASSTLEARRRGVPVLSYDRLVRKGGVDLYVSFDNELVGRLMARSAVSKAPRGDYLIVNGAKTDNNTSMFRAGYMDVLAPSIAAGRIRVIGETWTENWAEDLAYRAVDRVLDAGGRPDAIIAGNDDLAGAAIRALAERRLAGKVFVVGMDADLAACQRIVEGTQLSTVYKAIATLAARAAGAAVDLASRRRPQTTRVINDGREDIPYMVIEPVLVTRDNLDATVVADNYQKREDIYRNLPGRPDGGN
jgi:D-xylose transport system substrate-binding protein